MPVELTPNTTTEVGVTKNYLYLSSDLVSRLQAIKDKSIVARVILESLHSSRVVLDKDDNFNYLGISSEDSTKISYINYRRIRNMLANTNDLFTATNMRYHSSASKVIRKFFQQIPVTKSDQDNQYQWLTYMKRQGLFSNISDEVIQLESTTLLSYFTEQDIDHFNNMFRLEGYKQLDGGDIKLVTGHWISHFYLVDNYASQSGQLGNSCMRYSRCQSYLDIYVKNPKICSLAVTVNSEGKLQGRALVWTIDGVQYHDRIYATSDVIQDKMRAFFLTQGIQSCYQGDSGYIKDLIIYADTTNENFMERVCLDFSEYPYMDSFKFLNESRTKLANTDIIDYEDLLNQTDGSTENNSTNIIECDCCGREIEENDSYYMDSRHDDYNHQYLCSNCVVYSEHLSCYISEESAVRLTNDDYVYSRYAVQLPDGDYILQDEAVELENGNYAHHDDGDLAEFHDGGWFLMSETDYIMYNGEYYRVSECVETRDGIDMPREYTVEVNGEIWDEEKWAEEQNLNLI